MRQTGEFAQGPDHRVERVGDADHKSIWRVVANAFAHGFHHFEVDSQKIVAAHARLTRHTGGHNTNIRARDIGIGLRARHCRIKAFGWARLRDI